MNIKTSYDKDISKITDFLDKSLEQLVAWLSNDPNLKDYSFASKFRLSTESATIKEGRSLEFINANCSMCIVKYTLDATYLPPTIIINGGRRNINLLVYHNNNDADMDSVCKELQYNLFENVFHRLALIFDNIDDKPLAKKYSALSRVNSVIALEKYINRNKSNPYATRDFRDYLIDILAQHKLPAVMLNK